MKEELEKIRKIERYISILENVAEDFSEFIRENPDVARRWAEFLVKKGKSLKKLKEEVV